MRDNRRVFVVDLYGIKEEVIKEDLGDYYIISFIKDEFPEFMTWLCSKKIYSIFT